MTTASISSRIESSSQFEDLVEVQLSYELVHLLSDHLYHSPAKAIEELVVNAYDADATECRIYIPEVRTADTPIAIFDDGIGMDFDGLKALWTIGRSNKRDPAYEKARKRKQIGKFGIGKLATYAIASRLTYISKAKNKVLGVTFDFGNLTQSPTGAGKSVTLRTVRFESFDDLDVEGLLSNVVAGLGLEPEFWTKKKSWTLAVLEGLKDKPWTSKSADSNGFYPQLCP